MKTSDNNAWSEVVEASKPEMHKRSALKPELYAFYQDVVKRLERTSDKHALRYKFADVKTAEQYRIYLSGKARTRIGLAAVRTSVQQDGDDAYVFVARGKGWK